MRILIVAATAAELAPIRAALPPVASRPPWLQSSTFDGRDVDMVTTGVGMVATAVWTSRALAETRYDLALNVGVCGTFDRALPPGSVVHVVEDRIAELGAEDDDAFLTIDELDLPGEHVFVNAASPDIPALNTLPRVKGITVNTVHGSEASIAAVVRRFAPQVESMEGAAFMCACRIHGIPFAQVRGVSNIVEKRNREAWNLGEAIGCVGRAALEIVRQA